MIFNRQINNRNKKLLFIQLPFDKSLQSQYKLTNTKLHKAILEDDSKEVAKLLKDSKENQLVNAQSLLNTPLTLALKRGNIEIAKLILTSIHVDELMLNQKDARGLTALDIACMLRQNEIIKLILASPFVDIEDDFLALTLYRDNVEKAILREYLSKINSENIAGYMTESIVPCVPIHYHEPYTDLMIFFLQDICCNLSWLPKERAKAQAGASYVWFYHSFKSCYEIFCEKRNAIPVDQSLLEALKSSKDSDQRPKSNQMASLSQPAENIEKLLQKAPSLKK